MKKISAYKFTLVMVAVILVLVLMPGDDVPSVGIPHIDKVVHFGMFLTLTLCYIWEYHKKHQLLPKCYKEGLWLLGFAIFTEIMQYFVPGRSSDIKDLLADTLGVIVASLSVNYFIASKRKE